MNQALQDVIEHRRTTNVFEPNHTISDETPRSRVSDNPADFAKTSQAAISIAAMAIPVNPCGPINRKRP